MKFGMTSLFFSKISVHRRLLRPVISIILEIATHLGAIIVALLRLAAAEHVLSSLVQYLLAMGGRLLAWTVLLTSMTILKATSTKETASTSQRAVECMMRKGEGEGINLGVATKCIEAIKWWISIQDYRETSTSSAMDDVVLLLVQKDPVWQGYVLDKLTLKSY